MDAFIAGPELTYDFLSGDCRAKLSRQDWAEEMSLVTESWDSNNPFKLADVQIGDVTVVEIVGDRGVVTVQWLDPDSEPLGEGVSGEWVHERGRWLSTGCQTSAERRTATCESEANQLAVAIENYLTQNPGSTVTEQGLVDGGSMRELSDNFDVASDNSVVPSDDGACK